MPIFLVRVLALFLLIQTFSIAEAWTEKALDSSDPFVFAPNDLNTDSFRLDTKISWSWVPGSFEWVRVDHRMLVPRARVRIATPENARVRYHGKLIPPIGNQVEVLVVLTQEEKNQIEVNDQKIPIRFKRVTSLQPALIIDPSCSSAPLHFTQVKLDHSWAFVYCHTLHPKNGKSATSQIDLQIIWESEDLKSKPNVNGSLLNSSDGYTYEVSLQPNSPMLNWTQGEDHFSIESKIASVFHPFSVSLGLGPYSNQDKWVPFATLYAAYYFNEQLKLASFTALPLRSSPQVDSGLYIISEQFRGFDERMVVSLLLGAHVLSFDALGAHQFMFSAPQGVELNFRDAFVKSKNLLVGFFYYPKINERSYINSWVRYGSAKWFLELNYIHWQEPVGTTPFDSRSYGLSLGFPLFKAL